MQYDASGSEPYQHGDRSKYQHGDGREHRTNQHTHIPAASRHGSRPYGLGLSKAGMDDAAPAGLYRPEIDTESSIAMGQPTYEPWSGPEPMEALANSPSTAYFPWGAQPTIHDTRLHPMTSQTNLVPSKQPSYSSFHAREDSTAWEGASLHRAHRDYWDSSALQPSTSTFDLAHVDRMHRIQLPSTSQFTEKNRPLGGGGRTKLYEYGLHDENGNKTVKFWTLILAFAITVTLTALDMTMISTALPSIVEDLPSSEIAGGWITSAYLLTVTAFQPLFGGLSCVIGRRWSAVLAVILFIGGSVMCGFAHSILFLTIGRGVQGLGGGGIQAIGEITVSDITSLRERGFFVGIFGLVFAVSSFVAPVLGGYFSDHDWRWIFWINIPIGILALLMLIPTMNLPIPTMPFRTKLAKMDIAGNVVLLGSVVSILIAVTEGGVSHPWSSMRIWIPMVAGMAGFILFLLIEFVPNPLCTQPVLPLRLFSNKTACSAFLMTFVHGIATYGAIYALPIYFQAILDEKPLRSAVSTFPSTAPTAPFAIVAGIAMAVTGKYKNLTLIGWSFSAAGFAWMTRFHTDTSKWELIVAQIVAGIGIGILFAITLPPIQASLPVEELETATATYAFCRSFGAIWGIAITTSVLTASVSAKLGTVPQVAELGLTGPTVLGYVENIKNLPEALREPVRQMYADGLQKGMYAFMPVVIVGFVACFWIQDVPLPDFMRGDAADETKNAEKDGEPASEPQRGEQGVFHNQGCSEGKEHQAQEGEQSEDTTLVGSAEHAHKGQAPLEGLFDIVQHHHHHPPPTPEGYASNAFKYDASPNPASLTWEEKYDTHHIVTMPPSAHW